MPSLDDFLNSPESITKQKTMESYDLQRTLEIVSIEQLPGYHSQYNKGYRWATRLDSIDDEEVHGTGCRVFWYYPEKPADTIGTQYKMGWERA